MKKFTLLMSMLLCIVATNLNAQDKVMPTASTWYRLVTKATDANRINKCMELLRADSPLINQYSNKNAGEGKLWTNAQAAAGDAAYDYQWWAFEKDPNGDNYAIVCKAQPNGSINPTPSAASTSGRWSYDNNVKHYDFILGEDNYYGTEGNNYYYSIRSSETTGVWLNASLGGQGFAVNAYNNPVDGNSGLWTFVPDKNAAIEAIEALEANIAKAKALLDRIGTGLGQFSATDNTLEGALENAEVCLTYIDYIELEQIIEANTTLEAAFASLVLNLPADGSYIRIISPNGWNDDARYLSSVNSTIINRTDRAAFVANDNHSTIFYYTGGKLLSVEKAEYLANNKNFLGYNGVNEGTAVRFTESNNHKGFYNIIFEGNDDESGKDRCLFTNQDNYTDAGDDTDDRMGYCFELAEVNESELTAKNVELTVTDAGYATMYYDYALAIPEGAKAHTITLNGEWATLNEITGGVIPANTGVVIENAGGHTFTLPTKAHAAIAENVLEGSVETTDYEDDNYTYYILANDKDGVCFYADMFTQDKFTNNAHKAFFKVANTSAGPVKYSFRFPGEGTTGIEGVETIENAVYYDLSGRRVENPVKGIYIVNGKKVLVK